MDDKNCTSVEEFSVLPASDYGLIQYLMAEGCRLEDIADMAGVHLATLYQIVEEKTCSTRTLHKLLKLYFFIKRKKQNSILSGELVMQG